MATYILFWNPDISSYTRKRFLDDYNKHRGVGNWSFYEYEDVDFDDTFYMIKCGQGKTGIVMRGVICSLSYGGEDWSSKNRKNIYYADIEAGVTINPWSDAQMLTPEILTDAIPDFNWFGGHSGRRLTDDDATKLDDIWFEYLDRHPNMFSTDKAHLDEYNGIVIPERIRKKLFEGKEDRCEVCGYSPQDVFGKDVKITNEYLFLPTPVIGENMPKLFFNLCSNCRAVSDRDLARKITNS